jgi:hypothetical protein
MSLISVGMNVRHFEVGPGRFGEGGRGWRFGRVVGTEWIDMHANGAPTAPGGLLAVVVRFSDGSSELIPAFVVEPCDACAEGCNCLLCNPLAAPVCG